MIMALITVTIITRILKIYVERILPPIPSGTTSIMPANISSNILPEASAIIRRTGLVFTLAVVPATTGIL